MDYPWYVTPTERSQIQQGDFLFNFPIIEPSLIAPKGRGKAPMKVEADRVYYSLIVISHSCDISDGILDELGLIQLLPVYGYKDFVVNTRMSKDKQGNLHRDGISTHHLLEKCDLSHPDIPSEQFVVDFMNLKIAPIKEVRRFLHRRTGPPRLRLSHPYLEKMTLHFASTYSRIGLPQAAEKPKKVSHTDLTPTIAVN